MNRIFLIPAVFLLFQASFVEARKVDFKKGLMAPYLKGDIGTSSANQNAFGSSSGSAEFKDKVRYQFGAELGLSFKGEKVGFRIGGLFLAPQKMDAIVGSNAAGDELFNLTSNISGIFGVGHLEFSPKMNPESRIYISLGGGVGTVTILNSYVFKPAGTTAYSLSDFTEEGKAAAVLAEGAAGYEFVMADNASFDIACGYRSITHSGYKHERAVTTFQGAVGKGGDVKNTDGTARDVNLSSAFLSVGLRIHFN